jgi:hypothetical protein
MDARNAMQAARRTAAHFVACYNPSNGIIALSDEHSNELPKPVRLNVNVSHSIFLVALRQQLVEYTRQNFTTKKEN